MIFMKDETIFIYNGETYDELKDKPMFCIKTLVIGEHGFFHVGFLTLGRLLENVDTVVIKDSDFVYHDKMFSREFASHIKRLDLSSCTEIKKVNSGLMCCVAQHMKNLEEIILPDGVVEILGGTFLQFENLKKVNIPKSVRKIGETIFYRNVEIDELVISADMDNFSIEPYAFNDVHIKRLIIEKRSKFSSFCFIDNFKGSTIDELIIYDEIPEYYVPMEEFRSKEKSGNYKENIMVKKIIYKNSNDNVVLGTSGVSGSRSLDRPMCERFYNPYIKKSMPVYPHIYDKSFLEELTFPSNVKELSIPGYVYCNFDLNIFGTKIDNRKISNLLEKKFVACTLAKDYTFISYNNFEELVEIARKKIEEIKESSIYDFIFFVGPRLSMHETLQIRLIMRKKAILVNFIKTNIVKETNENVDEHEEKDEQIDSLLNEIKNITTTLPDSYKKLIKDVVNKYYNEYLNDFNSEYELSISNKRTFGTNDVVSSEANFISKLQYLVIELSGVKDKIEKLSRLCEYKTLIGEKDFEPKDEKENVIKKILSIANLLPDPIRYRVYDGLYIIIDEESEQCNEQINKLLIEKDEICLQLPKQQESLLKKLSDYYDLLNAYYECNKDYIKLLNTIHENEVSFDDVMKVNGLIATIRITIKSVYDSSLRLKLDNVFENILRKYKTIICKKIKLFNCNTDYNEVQKSMISEINLFLSSIKEDLKEDFYKHEFKEDLKNALDILRGSVIANEEFGIVSSLVFDINNIFMNNKNDERVGKERKVLITYLESIRNLEECLVEKDNVIKYLSGLLIDLKFYESKKCEYVKAKKKKDYVSKKVDEFNI